MIAEGEEREAIISDTDLVLDTHHALSQEVDQFNLTLKTFEKLDALR